MFHVAGGRASPVRDEVGRPGPWAVRPYGGSMTCS